jgi:hypothetical protein
MPLFYHGCTFESYFNRNHNKVENFYWFIKKTYIQQQKIFNLVEVECHSHLEHRSIDQTPSVYWTCV